MINVKFTTTELLGFDALAEKVNDECSCIMLMYKKYGKVNEFFDLLRDYFCTEITHDEPIEIKDIEAFILTDAKIGLIRLITVKEIDIDDIILLFEYLSFPKIISQYLAFIRTTGEFDIFIKIVVKYCNDYYGIKHGIADITLHDICLCIKEYTDFDSVFIHMKKDFDIKNR